MTAGLRRNKSKPAIWKVCNNKNMNMDSVRTDIEQAPWYICFLFEDIDNILHGPGKLCIKE